MANTTENMTAEDARTFEHFSVHNAVQAQLACPEASCEAYTNIFTYRRWRAQGYAVRKGENGTVVTTWITTRGRRDGEPKRRRKRAVLFCRHQVVRAA